MLRSSPRLDRTCEGITRRHVLQVGALAGLGLGLPQLVRAEHLAKPKKHTNCILIWTRGGTSHHDTFDPKPDAPVSVRGEFAAIQTARLPASCSPTSCPIWLGIKNGLACCAVGIRKTVVMAWPTNG